MPYIVLLYAMLLCSVGGFVNRFSNFLPVLLKLTVAPYIYLNENEQYFTCNTLIMVLNLIAHSHYKAYLNVVSCVLPCRYSHAPFLSWVVLRELKPVTDGDCSSRWCCNWCDIYEYLDTCVQIPNCTVPLYMVQASLCWLVTCVHLSALSLLVFTDSLPPQASSHSLSICPIFQLLFPLTLASNHVAVNRPWFPCPALSGHPARVSLLQLKAVKRPCSVALFLCRCPNFFKTKLHLTYISLRLPPPSPGTP